MVPCFAACRDHIWHVPLPLCVLSNIITNRVIALNIRKPSATFTCFINSGCCASLLYQLQSYMITAGRAVQSYVGHHCRQYTCSSVSSLCRTSLQTRQFSLIIMFAIPGNCRPWSLIAVLSASYFAIKYCGMLIERATQLIPCDHHSRLDVFSVELHTTVRFANKCRHVCSGWHRWLWRLTLLVVAADVTGCGG